MALRKKKILLFMLFGCLGAAFVFLPLLVLAIIGVYGSIINWPFAHCEIMEKTRFEEAIHQGFDVNAGCCAEHMIGECLLGWPNSTPLVFAAENEKADAVRLLLEHGADINQTSNSGYPLAVAASNGNIDIAQVLLSRNANHESQDIALGMAAHFGNIDIVKLILNRVAPDHIAGSCETLACSLASELEQNGSPHLQKQRELFLHLIGTCLDPDIFCGSERLLSRIGKNDAHAPLIKALLEHGADLNAKEKSGKTLREYLKSFWDYDSRPQIKSLIEREE